MTLSDKRYDVVSVGSWTNFDHLYEVDRLPEPGDTVQLIDSINAIDKVYWGGCAPNTISTVARLGGNTALISVVGEDFSTRGYEKHLHQLGVGLEALIVVKDAYCGHSFLFRDPDGQSICLSHLGVAQSQDQYHPDEETLTNTKVAILNYRFDEFTLLAGKIAKASGASVIINGALTTAPSYVEQFIRISEVLICTEHEVSQLLSHLELRDPTNLFAFGLQALVITEGAKGSHLLTQDVTISIPAIPVTQVVDPTGAGDSFVGGIAYGLAMHWELARAIKLGTSVASFIIEAVGCQTNLPTLEQVLPRLGQLTK